MHISKLTPAQLKELAPKAGTTYGSLRQAARGNSGISSSRAIAIELAGREMGLDLPREAHNAGCAVCEFAVECRKKRKKRASAR